MKKAGIREARQNLSALLEYVKRGHEIEITERGTTVARLVPACPRQSKPYRNHAAFRRTMPDLDPPLSQTITQDREDRI